ncbi:MAG: helix-turn-helix domain-containing protein [Verrucomicrobiaceae bacterium]|nr:helix-turn-helix domain-containing protein [Verrucomicrobiaceae bacterium]
MHLTLGQRMKAAREARGLSLADAAHETRVPAQRLHHLETDNIAAFGSMTYARSFLKLYSDYLDVDASEVLHELPPAMLGGPQDYRYLTDSLGPWLAERKKPSVRLSEPVSSSSVQTIKSPVPAGIGIFLFLVALAGLYGQYVATLKKDEPVVQTIEQTTTAAQETSVAAEAPPAIAPVDKVLPAEPVQVQPAIPVDPIVIAPPTKNGLIELNPREGL